MNNFRFNLKGQLNEVKLPEYKALWPLFETIVNSIQSIEESTNSQNGQITILANRLEDRQVNMDGNEELNPFYEFQVIDNGEGFNSINYNSFLEAYSNLKVSKGCKGIGRFLWLKAFTKVNIESVYCEKNRWLKRRFEFSADNGIEPEKNIEDSSISEYKTVVTLSNFILKYRKKAPLSLEALAKKVIEHCLPYFLGDNCPHIVLRDNLGETYDLNKYFDSTIKDSLHRDEFEKDGNKFSLYHIRMAEGAVKHELHFCASKREVKSYDLSQYITDLQKRIVTDEGEAFYYLGYLTGEYLDRNVNLNRTAFDFEEEDTLFASVSERELIEIAKEYILAYLIDDLKKIKDAKRDFIDSYVQKEKPQYRYLLNRKPELYDQIPANLSKEKLELELHSATQKWETEIHSQGREIEKKVKDSKFDRENFSKMLCHIAKLVNEGFFYDGGRIRGIPVQIGGTNYVPPLPIETVVIERIDEIRSQDKEPIEIAIELCMYCMKTQVFKDGNKRASVIFANHYLIAQGMGFLVIPEKDVPEFKKLLVQYYEGEPLEVIGAFLKERCWKNF